jgi:glycosyltransferase involved in cell wall biosynthesis
MSTKLSIITINYNNCAGLKRTIDSVVSQSFKDYEWIVIDGGSKDGSKDLIEQYSDSFTYWVSEPDNGIYNAMNKGIEKANGEWMLFLNSGDWLYDNDTLKQVFSKSYDADILYGDVMYHWPDGRGQEMERKPDKISLYFFYTDTLCHQATFYRKNIFNTHKYNESFRICSDWALYIQLLTEGYRFQHLPFCISNFAQDGISTHLTAEHLAEREHVFNEYFADCIRPDLDQLKKIDESKKYIESHRSYKFIMATANRIISIMEKIVYFFENKRAKHTPQKSYESNE